MPVSVLSVFNLHPPNPTKFALIALIELPNPPVSGPISGLSRFALLLTESRPELDALSPTHPLTHSAPPALQKQIPRAIVPALSFPQLRSRDCGMISSFIPCPLPPLSLTLASPNP